MSSKMVALIVLVGVVNSLSLAIPSEIRSLPELDNGLQQIDQTNFDMGGINGELLMVPVEAVHEHYRQKRATCDLFSGFGVNHSACSIHCIARGFRGGWCDSRAVCNCRR